MTMMRVKERMRGILREKMMRMRTRAIGELLRREAQEAQGMVILFALFFPQYGLLMTLSRR